MHLNYKEALVKIISNKISAIDKQNYFDFYSESLILSTAFNIASFILAIDKLIDVDKSNENISSRYTLHENDGFVQSIYDNKDFRDYFSNVNISEPQGNNVWFLYAIRNAIVHGGIQYIDLEKNEISIKSNSNLNRIDCTIPLDFFSKFIKKYRELPANTKPIHEFIVELKDNYEKHQFNHKKNGYRLNYMIEVDTSNDLDSDLIKSFTEEITRIFDSVIRIVYGYDEEEEYMKEVQDIIYKIDSTYHLPKTSLQYESKLNKEIGKFILEKISSTYPQYKISIRKLKNPLQFAKSKPIIKRNFGTEVSIHLYRARREKNNFLDELLYLQKEFEINSKYVSRIKEYLTPETQKKLFKLNFNGKFESWRRIILKSIHKTRSQQGLSHSYIDGCFESIDYLDELNCSDTKNIKLKDTILKYMRQYNVDRIPEDVKASFISNHVDFFDNLDKTNRRKNIPSPEDIEVYKQLFDDNKLESFIKYSKLQKDRIMVGLLYTYGINVYVASKEQESPNVADYEYTNLSNINLYTSERTNIVQQQLHSKLKEYDKSIRKLESSLKNPNLPDKIKQKYLDLIMEYKIERQKAFEDAAKERTTEVGGKKLTLDDDDTKKASVIRNCLAHNGRIRIKPKNKNDKGTYLSLLDSQNGMPTALINCELSDLLKFIELDYRNRFLIKYKTKINSVPDPFEK